MNSVRNLNRTGKDSLTMVKAVSLVIGACIAAGIIAVDFLNGQLGEWIHILPVTSI
jgi:hypothetical protein